MSEICVHGFQGVHVPVLLLNTSKVINCPQLEEGGSSAVSWSSPLQEEFILSTE